MVCPISLGQLSDTLGRVTGVLEHQGVELLASLEEERKRLAGDLLAEGGRQGLQMNTAARERLDVRIICE